MNEIDDQLRGAVAARAGFEADDVARLVTRRRRARRVVGGAAASFIVVGVAATVLLSGGDDEPDLEAVDDPTTTTTAPAEPTPTEEDPFGPDGVEGAMSDLHVETPDRFGFIECGADGEPGPPTGDRAAELEAAIEALRDGGLHDQPFAVSSGGPQSIYGVPSIGLSSNYEPTLEWIAERVDPADVCVEFAEFGIRNLPPALAEVVVAADAAAGEVTVTAVGCAPKGEWVAPFRQLGDGTRLGIAVGRGQSNFVDDCPGPTTYVFDSVTKDVPMPATEPGTLDFADTVAAGGSIGFSFDPVNVAAARVTTGDDLIAQLLSDPTVQFQVSDVFSAAPLAGPVGEVAEDQWPIEGSGTIAVPLGLPAGTYSVRFVDTPELNGLLEIDAAGCGQPDDGPDQGWVLPDRNGDCVAEVADSLDGVIYVSNDGSYERLLDADGLAVTVPTSGDASFACDNDWGIVIRYIDESGNGMVAPSDFDDLVIIGGVGAWIPSVADVLEEFPLPANGSGCIGFARG